MSGWKTISFGGLLAVAPGLLSWLEALDTTKMGLSPVAGTVIGAVVIGLRLVTTGPVGGKKED